MIDCWQYIFHFTAEERIKIRREDDLRECRTLIGIVAGALTTVAVFLSAWPWRGGPDLITGYAAYGSIPAGLLAGAWVRHWIPHYVHRRWMTVWHPLVKARRDAEGWETLTPPPPLTLTQLIDRRVITLDASGCTFLATAGLFLLLMALVPAVTAHDQVRWLWAAGLLAWLPAGLLLGEALAKAVSPRRRPRCTRG